MPTASFLGWMMDSIRRAFPSMNWIVESNWSPRKSFYAKSPDHNGLITTEYTESRIDENINKH